MKNGVKFHSIFYRFILFIFLVFLTVISMILDAKKAQIRFFNLSLTIGQEELKIVTVAVLLLTFLLSFMFKWKCLIHKTGIYLRKIDLFVDWNAIRGLSHVWINEYHRGPHGFLFYNRKTLVIYRENYQPICLYNIPILALYVAKCYHPKLKTNIVSATLASLFNMALNAWFLYEMFSKNLVNINAEVFMFWLLLYAVKVFALPLVMLGHENHCYGVSLVHSTAYKKNASKAIHL
ncbi:hypothetical protein HMPREF9965_1928 [Streptococcus mitis bv. 2 str. SK95]|uniref:Uncharacterized protein n=1 Tax=Streptococcus mitis bv. 2 str. SK95 TaxID=1000588 RepID=F9LWW8_STROR|nr:hypothetical protein [Streptococcus mitis]EGU66442.1 hypothetical protein HMPREF9965_1928 [Streptococcus mitis bv. 2 str. SK95]